jgi:hydroxymethylglutaryl-CoA reductase
MMALRYYKLTHGGDVVHEIDIPNMVRTIGGVDQLSAAKKLQHIFVKSCEREFAFEFFHTHLHFDGCIHPPIAKLLGF